MRYVCINKDLANALRIILAFVAGMYITIVVMSK